MFDPIFGQIRGLFCPASKCVNNLETVPRSNVPNLLFYLLHAVSPGFRKDFIIPELFVKPFRRLPTAKRDFSLSPNYLPARNRFGEGRRTHYSELFPHQPKIRGPSLHIHPIQPHPAFIADSEGLVSPLTHTTVFFFMILVIIVVKA